MIEFEFTDEEIEVLKEYRKTNQLMINQLLVSNGESDIALLSKKSEDMQPFSYDRESVRINLDAMIRIYEIMLKSYYSKENSAWSFVYGTTLAEIEKLKNEIYIDYFLHATENKEIDMPTIINFIGDNDVPYINIDETLKIETDTPEILIAPFTKIKEFKEAQEIQFEENRKLPIYSVTLEKQDLQELTFEEKEAVYNYILTSADVVNQKLQESINYDEDTLNNNENIRKLEQLLSKYELEIKKKIDFKDYPESEQLADKADIERIKSELSDLQDSNSNIFEEKKMAVDFITKWKKNIAVYVMAEFKELEMKYEAERKVLKENYSEKMKKYEEEAKEKHEKLKEGSLEEIAKAVDKECDENIILAKRLIEDIKKLITKQQNHAKIAGNIGATYSALNNAFDMKKVAETLLDKVTAIRGKAKELCEEEDRENLSEKLLKISEVNLQVGTLINYLNNPKSSVGQSKINRFEEMTIIEENELKRGIAETILNVRGEAELKKLKEDLEILEEKGAFKRFIGFFTGSNKLDEVKEEQIEIRQKAIRKTLSQKMSLVYNYSIHELVAEIQMFLEDNEDDELVEEDMYILQNMENELRRNFIISDSKVRDIIEQRENKNLPVEVKRITKRELIEIETYRFLNKYGYDRRNDEEENNQYKDTMQNEIARIVDYISSSKILEI
ncbi:MAG: hypothetical protein OSJ66_08010 [Clostridia bacterium]|nr:hypothetical protein [Clostridia bacterium]